MIDIYFATNRTQRRSKKRPFGDRFHQDGPHFYRVGVARAKKVSDDLDEGYKVEGVEVVPETAPEEKGGEDAIVGSSALFSALRRRMVEDGRDILIYIHGFANSFESCIERGAQLKQAYLIQPPDGGAPYEPHVFVFSWPSNGSVTPPWEYFDDRDDAAASGVAMARSLKRLLDFLASGDEPCPQRLHLVAHSMGNWALRHAVQGIRALLDSSRLPKIFHNVFLMGSDEDDDALEHDHKLRLLTELARAIHVYHNVNDTALVVSDKTKFRPTRLGTHGPRTFSGLSTQIVALDCSKVGSTSLFHGGHQYYRIRPEVIADVRHVLSGGFRPDEVPGRDAVEPGRRFRIRAQRV